MPWRADPVRRPFLPLPAAEAPAAGSLACDSWNLTFSLLSMLDTAYRAHRAALLFQHALGLRALLGQAHAHRLSLTAGLHLDLVIAQKTSRRKGPLRTCFAIGIRPPPLEYEILINSAVGFDGPIAPHHGAPWNPVGPFPESPHQKRLHRRLTESGSHKVACVIGLRGFIGSVDVEFGDFQFLPERLETIEPLHQVVHRCVTRAGKWPCSPIPSIGAPCVSQELDRHPQDKKTQMT